MAAKELNGKAVSELILNDIRDTIAKYNYTPSLAIVTIGEDEASKVYIRNKQKAAEQCGIILRRYTFSADDNPVQVAKTIAAIDTDGVIVQLPLPFGWSEEFILSNIAPEKDVDGFTNYNQGGTVNNTAIFSPCTPKGIMRLLREYYIGLRGVHVVIVGRSNIVGKPLANLMINEDATVTVCHSKTKNLKKTTKQADILVSAIGKPKYFDKSYIKKGAIVIDVGINRDKNGKLCGDCDFESMRQKASLVTPVPRGVGPMTVAMLMLNTLYAHLDNLDKKFNDINK